MLDVEYYENRLEFRGSYSRAEKLMREYVKRMILSAKRGKESAFLNWRERAEELAERYAHLAYLLSTVPYEFYEYEQ